MVVVRSLTCALLALALAPITSADLTSAVIPDFRGWENTSYAGWNDWTNLTTQGAAALPDDPASNAALAEIQTTDLSPFTVNAAQGEACIAHLPIGPEVLVGYGDHTRGPIDEVVLQISHPGSAAPDAVLQYIGNVPGNPDPDYLGPVEVLALAPGETYYRFTASQLGLPLGAFGTFTGFAVLLDFGAATGQSCLDEVQLDVRHALDGEVLPVCSPSLHNSLNVLAGMDVAGSSVAADNLLLLRATGIPELSFGLMLASRSTQSGPCQSGCAHTQGVLCLAGSIARLGPPQLAGPDRSLSQMLDLTSIPVSPPAAVMAGSTWYFQTWYRDANPQPTSNFTLATGLLFR